MADDEEFLRLKNQGELLGLTAGELTKYITDIQRDLRAERREAEKQKEEAEKEKAKREHEEKMTQMKLDYDLTVMKEKHDREREKEKHDREREKEKQDREKERLDLEKEEKQRDHEYRMKQLDAERTTNSDSKKVPSSNQYFKTKLPHFDENKDDIDSYIRRFESCCQCPLEQKCLVFSTLLRGTALDVYSAIDSPELTWEQLKTEMLKKFQCSAQGFRQKFRSSKPKKDESFSSYIVLLARYLDRWIELSKTEKTFAAFRDLILREQLLCSVSKHLHTYLLEKNVDNLSDMVDCAESYRIAHPDKVLARKEELHEPISIGYVANQNFSEHQDDELFDEFANMSQQRNYANDARKAYFRREQKRGHFNTFPKQRGRGSQRPIFQPPQRSFPTPQSSDNTTDCVYCFYCGAMNSHMKSDCPDFRNTCTRCNKEGHRALNCKLTKKKTHEAHVLAPDESTAGLLTESATVNGIECTLLRDTGCTTAGVKKALVRPDQYTGKTAKCKTFGGNIETFPLASISITSPYCNGQIVACVINNPVCDLILGNLPNVSTAVAGQGGSFIPCLVSTRAQSKKTSTIKPLPAPDIKLFNLSPAEISQLQMDDPEIVKLHPTQDPVDTSKPHFSSQNGLLYRLSNGKHGHRKQLLIPQKLRQTVLRTAHDAIFSGHCGVKRTLHRVTTTFFWPGVTKDVKLYCRACDICQRTVPKGRIPAAPLQKMPIVTTPFERVSIDIVGPIETSDSGFRYILTIVDVATRYPDAYPLKNIDTATVAEALVQYFTRVGVPKEILSDRGTQFMSSIMQEVFRLLSVSHSTTTPYHPQSNGLVERFNGVLKTMLKRIAADRPKAWPRYIPALLFAYRELPNETLGFSPFELVYGHCPRGPMQILSDQWSGQSATQESKTVYQYVFDLHNKIHDACKIAQDNAKQKVDLYKTYADRKAKTRIFKPGSKVLVLLSDEHSKMNVKWKGPYTIFDRISDVNYKINIDGVYKVLHVNMLKQYFDSVNTSVFVNYFSDLTDKDSPDCAFSEILSPQFEPDIPVKTRSENACVSISCFSRHDDNEDNDQIDSFVQLPTLSVQGETVEDVQISADLSHTQRCEMKKLLYSYSDVLTDKPGNVTNVVPHRIVVTDETPVRVKPYPLPFAKRDIVEKELKVMLDLGVIEPSDSPYTAPIVLAPKPDGSVRFCIDYRRLNCITVFDAEPIPDFEAILCKLSNAKFYAKIDLSKGYWQIPMNENDKPKTAFQTPFGLFQWVKMPFGLRNAPATFARMMRKLQLHHYNAENFFDDILVHSHSWNALLVSLKNVLEKLRQFGLTARPSKFLAGFKTLNFLGHVISVGGIAPEPKKVEKILTLKPPKTKKQVRSLLGLLSYYRRYVPHFAHVTAPLTDLTRDGKTKSIVWTPQCQQALESIQILLNKFPVLLLPSLDKPFTLRTDASSQGMGAVLLQQKDGLLHPVHFASKKLSQTQMKYSTIERECLAIVWSCQKFSQYLIGRQFTLQTDHRPLTFLKANTCKNSRLLRWSLLLQEYDFEVRPISGTDNVFADLLSRQ